MVALLREFPDVRAHLQPGAVAARAARGVRRGSRARSHARAGPQAGGRAHRRRQAVHPRQLLPRAARADDRAVSALRRAAAPARACRRERRRAAGVHRRRLSRPAGVAQAGVGRPVLRGSDRARERRWSRRAAASPRTTSACCATVELEILRAVVPEYRAAAARGQVELSASPFYHPILPLLCDTDVYLRTHPQSRMPRQRFRHPEDALAQLRTRRRSHHERTFGQPPGRAVAVGRVGLGRDGAAGGAGRASAGWRPTS